MRHSLRSYLELAATLAWREVVVRYKRSTLGVAWALADPVLHVAVYLLTFGAILDAGRGVANYPVFTLLGVLAWLFFSMALDQASGVVMEHAALIRKIAFPTELLVASVLVSRTTSLLIGLALSLGLTGVIELVDATELSWARVGFLPIGIVLLLLLTGGLSLLAGALGVIFGDAQFIVRFVLRIGFFACPIVYPLERVPEAARALYELNPMVAILWCFQAMAASTSSPSAASWAAATIGAVVSFVGGLWLFRRLRSTMAELV